MIALVAALLAAAEARDIGSDLRMFGRELERGGHHLGRTRRGKPLERNRRITALRVGSQGGDRLRLRLDLRRGRRLQRTGLVGNVLSG